MRKRLILGFVTFCLLAISCELETSDNGKLDGFWLLRSVDTLSTGASVDVSRSMVSWAFQGRLMLAKVSGQNKEILFSFEHQGDSLILFDPYVSEREEDDIKVTDAKELQKVGVMRLREGYKVLELSSGTMRLQSNALRLTFEKY